MDGRHTPALYSRFLSSLLAKHTSTDAASRLDRPGDLGDTKASSYDSYHIDERPLAHDSHVSWPDIDVGTQPLENGGAWTGAGYCSYDMDLSLSYFVRTVTQNFPTGIQQENSIAHDWQGWGFSEGQVHGQPSSGMEWWQGRNEMI